DVGAIDEERVDPVGRVVAVGVVVDEDAVVAGVAEHAGLPRDEAEVAVGEAEIEDVVAGVAVEEGRQPGIALDADDVVTALAVDVDGRDAGQAAREAALAFRKYG